MGATCLIKASCRRTRIGSTKCLKRFYNDVPMQEYVTSRLTERATKDVSMSKLSVTTTPPKCSKHCMDNGIEEILSLQSTFVMKDTWKNFQMPKNHLQPMRPTDN